jgi:hypothetical protein
MAPWFTDNDGFLVVGALLRYPRISGLETHGFKLWTRKMGRFVRMSYCSRFDSDAKANLELLGQQLHIRYTCYRDLGGATEQSVPK